MQLCLIRSTRSVHNEERTLWYRCIYMHKPMYTHMRPPPPPPRKHTHCRSGNRYPTCTWSREGRLGRVSRHQVEQGGGGEAAPHAEVLHDDPNNLVLL
jgi:hypothetical protein